MNLQDLITRNPDLVRQVAASVGTSEGDALRGIEELLPALSRGMRNNTRQPGGLDALLGALAGGQHANRIDDLSQLGKPDAVLDGNAILGHVLGSRDASRNVAGHAAGRSGLDPDLLKRLLPVLASVVMGVLAKEQGQQPGGFGTQAGRNAGGSGGVDAGDLLGQLLDADGDGSVIDDVLNLAQKFF